MITGEDGERWLALAGPLADRLARGDERFVITGASGWFGLTTLALLHRALGSDGFDSRVTALASTPRRLTLHDGTCVEARALDELPVLCPSPTHILHYAYPTKDRVAGLGVERYVRMTAQISLTMIRAIEAHRPLGVFFTSAGSVYGVHAGDVAADPYGACKRLDELVLRQACRDADTFSIVARVFAVSGPYINKCHLYALADLITQVKTGSEIRVWSRRPVRRSHVAVTDIVAIALAELLDPSSSDLVFDTGGDEVLEVGELAARVRGVLGRPGLPIDRAEHSSTDPDDYYGDASSMQRLAARHGFQLCPLDDQIRYTAAAWG